MSVMDDPPVLRRSTRIRNTVTAEPTVKRPSVQGRKRKIAEAFTEFDPDNDTPVGIIIKTETLSDADLLAEQHTLVKYEPLEQYALVKQESHVPSMNASIRTDLSEHNDVSVSASTILGHLAAIKREIDDDYTPEQSKLKQTKKARVMKKELTDDEDSMDEKPKRKRATKKKKEPAGPHRLVVTADMARPRGEKRPPMIYPVIKQKRDPRLPSLVFEMVAGFSEAVKRARARTPRLKPGEKESRLLPYVEEPSDHYHAAHERADTQRLFVLQRQRGMEEDCHAHHQDCPIEEFLLSGRTGNVYTTTITHKPTCTCPDYIFRKRNCKHILYILHNTLKVPDHLKYQDAFLTSELREIAAHAPPMPEDIKEESTDGKRKPVEDDCPICCMEFKKGEDVVWCEASCGNNVHKECFQKWAQTRPQHVTCPFCRSEWLQMKAQTMTLPGVNLPTFRNSNGYLNVADQLGYD